MPILIFDEISTLVTFVVVKLAQVFDGVFYPEIIIIAALVCCITYLLFGLLLFFYSLFIFFIHDYNSMF